MKNLEMLFCLMMAVVLLNGCDEHGVEFIKLNDQENIQLNNKFAFFDTSLVDTTNMKKIERDALEPSLVLALSRWKSEDFKYYMHGYSSQLITNCEDNIVVDTTTLLRDIEDFSGMFHLASSAMYGMPDNMIGYTSTSQNIIVIRDTYIASSDEDALAGLLAHEMLHLIRYKNDVTKYTDSNCKDNTFVASYVVGSAVSYVE